MKYTKLTLLSTLFAATLCLAPALLASGNGDAAAAFAIMHAHLDSVNMDLTTGKLTQIHEHAEAINDALKNLAADSTLDATKKKRVQGCIKNIAKLTDSMHDAADEKKTAEAKKWAKKVVAQAELLEKQFHGSDPHAGHKK